jgi:hypothetical protein
MKTIDRHDMFLSTVNCPSCLWVVLPFSVGMGYQHFGGPCCLSYSGLHPEYGEARSSETLVSYCNAIWHHNPEDLGLKLHCLENLKSFISKLYLNTVNLSKKLFFPTKLTYAS